VNLTKYISPFSVVNKAERWTILVVESLIGLGVWQLFGNSLIPGPIDIMLRVFSILTTASFWHNFMNSLTLTSVGMGISIGISLLFAYASVVPVFTPITNLIMRLRYLTLTGLIFVFTLLTANGSQLKLSLLLFGIIPFFVTSLMSVLHSINPQEYELAKTLKMNPFQTLLEVIIIGRLDQALDVMRQNFAISWMMITMVEGLSMSEGGLGTMIIKSNKYIDLHTVFALLVIIFTVGILFDFILKKLRQWIFPYTAIASRH